MNISTRAEYKHAMRFFDGVAKKQLPFSTSLGLNRATGRCRDEVMKVMLNVLDRPTPFTLEAFAVKFATKRNLTAYLYAKPKQDQYLAPLVFGETETKKHIVPGKNAKLNQYGNLPRRASKAKGTFNVGNKVFKRTGRGKNKKLIMVGHFPAQRSYKKILPFERTVERAFTRWFPYEWKRAFNRAMLTAR